MNFELSEEQKIIQNISREFALNRLKPIAAKNDEDCIFPIEIYKELGKLGLLGINVSEKYGGSEAGVISYAIAIRELAKVDASIAVTTSVTNMVCEIIEKFGTEEQKMECLPILTSGEGIAGSFALSEAQSGSDAASLKTKAQKRGDYYIINGEKMWITSGAYSHVIIVFARTNPELPKNKGISAFIVRKDQKGFRIGREEKKLGIRSSNTCSLIFEDCEVHKKYLLGNEGDGFKIAMTALDGGRIGIASQANGIALAAFEEAVKYSLQRKQFDQYISDFQFIQNYISEMATLIDAGWLLTVRAAYLKEKGEKYSKEAAMAKLFNSEMSNKVTSMAIQIHGAYGYTKDFPVERFFRDAKVTTIYEGTSEIQRIVIARNILREFASLI